MNHKQTFLLFALTAALFLTLDVASVFAGGTVTNCSDDSDFSGKLAGGGTVNFSCGTATIYLSSIKTIAQNTTIDGGGTIALSGRNSLRLFVVNSGVSLTLTNITIRDANFATDGGAILNNGTTTIINSKFLSNTVASGFSGGAIESFGIMNISNSEFAYNSAGNGGALFPRESTSLTTISASSFHDNQTTNTTNGFGGAMMVWNGAQMNIDSTGFINNNAKQGGAIYLTSVSILTLTNSTVNGNFGTVEGGGLYVNGTALVNNSHLTSNSARGVLDSFGSGGGIYVDTNGALTLNDSTLSGNPAGNGGGILNKGTATLNNSTLSGNRALNTYDGGGINNSNLLTLNGVTLNGNLADNNGGGIANNGVATLINSTFSSNGASFYGGGIFNNGAVTLTNVTLNLNSATTGGGFYHYASTAANTFGIKNTIVANNAPGNNCAMGSASASNITSFGYNLSSDNSCQSFFTAPTDLPSNTDPNLGSLANNGGPTLTHMPLTPDSPGIDRIPKFTNGCGTTISTDQRGAPRALDGKCDIGAVEFGALLPWLYLPLILR